MTQVSTNHLRRISDPGIARTMFSLAVNRVIIETSSYCNRRCGYCPNSQIDRISEKKYLDADVYHRVLRDLSSIEYRADIVLHYYNEPLADPYICDRIKEAAAACPRANIEIYTNGDYLNREMVERLAESGLTSMVISVHLGNDSAWSDADIVSRLCDLSVRIGIPAKVDQLDAGAYIKARFPHKRIRIVVDHRDYYAMGYDRGELMKNVAVPAVSNRPCLQPFTESYVSWSGDVFPCCNVHPDVAEHQRYKIGNLRDFSSIFDAYANSDLVDWRKTLSSGELRKSPCTTCALGVFEEQTIQALRNLYKVAQEQEAAAV